MNIRYESLVSTPGRGAAELKAEMGHLKTIHSALARPSLTQGGSRSPHQGRARDAWPQPGSWAEAGRRSRPSGSAGRGRTRGSAAAPRHRPTRPPRPPPARGGTRPCAHQPVDLHLLHRRVSRGGGFAFALSGREAAAGRTRAFLARRHGCSRTAGKGNTPHRKRRRGRGGARPNGPGRNAAGRAQGPALRGAASGLRAGPGSASRARVLLQRPCLVPGALCSVPCAPCTVPCALCRVSWALSQITQHGTSQESRPCQLSSTQNHLHWKKPPRSSSPAHDRTPPCHLNHVTKCHIQRFLNTSIDADSTPWAAHSRVQLPFL